MNDTWNPQGQNTPDDVQQTPETTMPADPAEAPVTAPEAAPVTPSMDAAPTAEPAPVQEPVQTQQPAQPPYNGWSSDGSYRYVPPRTGAVPPYPGTSATPPTPGNNQQSSGAVPPAYQPPVYTATNTGWQTPPVVQTPSAQPEQPTRKKSKGWVAVIAIVAAVALVLSFVIIYKPNSNDDTFSNTDDGFVSPGEGSGIEDAPSLEISKWDDDDGGLSTREVVNRNLDSTVVLTNYVESGSFQFGESSLVEVGAASGIIMSEDGYIITNWHCVINEETGARYARIDVATHDGTVYEDADIIGADESTDLAIIKIDAKGLSVAEFGDSATLEVGDRVIALGNAAGLSWTATQGIVSALARDVYDDTGYAIKCLQTDAAINPGNSGGPLLNKQGLVVGINSSKIAASGYEGLGFSIPINEAKSVIDSLLTYGYVKGRVALGITGQTVSSGMYSGFLIASIGEGSSLQGTEAMAGDLIVAVDDVEVTDYGELRSELAKHKVGDRVTLTLLRSESRSGRVSSFTVTVTLKEQTAQ